MSRAQISAIAVALMLQLVDGFDVAVMAYTAPALSEAWGINPVMLGYLLSASLFGMAAGSIFLAPLADRIGRRPLSLIALTVACAGMFASVFAVDVVMLLIARVVTGLGIGGLIANLNVLVSELSSDRRRGLAMGLYTAGFPIGATFCGLIAAFLIPRLGWQSVFLVGAVLTAILGVVCAKFLPESLDFLVNRRPKGALDKVNRLLTRFGHPQVDDLPPQTTAARNRGSGPEILGSGPALLRSVLLWLGYAAITAGYYFASTWTPKIVANVTGDSTVGVTMGTLANFGGILGSVVFGLATLYFGVRRVLIGALLLGAAAFVVFGTAIDSTSVALTIVALLGLLTTAGITGFYTLAPQLYSASARATATGWMIGAGRFVSIVSPIFVGYLFAANWAPQSVFNLYTIPLVLAAVCVVAVRARRTDEVQAPAAR